MLSEENSLIAWWPFDEKSGHLTLEKVSGRLDEVAYVFNEARYKPASDPLWQPGISGEALLFDGYSTWLTCPAEAMPAPGEALSIEVWVAPRSFGAGAEGRLLAFANQHDREACQGYVFGCYRHGAWSWQVGSSGKWLELWSGDSLLPINRWSYLLATFDGPGGRMALYRDGQEVASKKIPPGSRITPYPGDFMVGKNNQSVKVEDIFAVNMFNGRLDELRIYQRALEPWEITARYTAYLEKWPGEKLPQPDSLPQRQRYAGDPYRPRYHFVPEHWMNEPHAPLYFNGLYHLFYQHNPQGPYWHHIHWGHAVSPDLVRWRDLPFALAPALGEVDPDGCWSGSAALENGVPLFFYTAGDNTKSPNQAVAIARSTFKQDGDTDLVHWQKDKEPVITQAGGVGLFGEFRDPFAWKDGDKWYVLVGSGLPGQGGTALLYSSPDLLEWTYHGPFFSGDVAKYPETGDVWELPVFLPLGQEKYLLLVNPWFGAPSPYYCKYVFYWIGRWDKANRRFVPDQEAPQVYDLGETAIGPSGMIDPQGRVVVFTLAHGGLASAAQSYDLGWAHNASLPVILKLREDGRLGVEALPELKSLREETLLLCEEKSLAEANDLLAGIGGKQLEIVVEFEAGAAGCYGLKVCATPDGEEETRLIFDSAGPTLTADRTKSSLAEVFDKKTVGGELPLAGQPLQLHVFIDHSMVEVYASQLKSLTTRVYPTRPDAVGLRLWADNTVKVKKLAVWKLGSIYRDCYLD